jgi:hypothetical protein
MATPYDSIYQSFLQKISDYSFLSMDDTTLKSNLFGYLKSSITKFKRCKNNLSQRDDISSQFYIDLTDEEIEILSIYMMVEYLSPKLVTSDLIQQSLSAKDYNIYSQANHIKEIRTLRDTYKLEAEQAMVRYTLYNADLSDMQ